MKPASFNDLNSFIKGWFIDQKICDNLINYFENNQSKQVEGRTNYGVDKKTKISTDIGINLSEQQPRELIEYFFSLQEALEEYKKVFPVLVHSISKWSISEGCNIQKYQPNEGYFATHCECLTLETSHRMLVFTTYLNDVNDGGQTEFPLENLKIQPQKGLTVFFPPGWTHPHRGIVSPTETKYIITGWYSFTV